MSLAIYTLRILSGNNGGEIGHIYIDDLERLFMTILVDIFCTAVVEA